MHFVGFAAVYARLIGSSVQHKMRNFDNDICSVDTTGPQSRPSVLRLTHKLDITTVVVDDR